MLNIRKLLTRITSIVTTSKSADRANHGEQRWRRIAVSAISTIASRGFSLGCNLLIIPLAVGYLGPTNYGIWITLTSSVALLSFFDFGVGIGLQNRVSKMLATEKQTQIAQCLRSTGIVLTIISTSCFTVLAAAITRTDVAVRIFKDPSYSQVDLQSSLLVVLGAFAFGLPLSLFSRIAIGLQQGWIVGAANSFGSGLGLVAIVSATLTHPSFSTFVLLTVLPPILSQLVCYFLLLRQVPGGLPLFGSVSLAEGMETLRQGSRYVLPQIAGAILTQSPMFFLGTLTSPINAGVYGILIRISAPLQQLQQIILTQIWPAITEALHRGDVAWLKISLRRLISINLLFAVCGSLLVLGATVLLYPILMKNPLLQPPLLVFLLYAVNAGLTGVIQGLAYVANALSRLGAQNYIALMNILLAFTALPFCARHGGLYGVLLVLLITNGLVTLPLLYREYCGYLRELDHHTGFPEEL